MKTYQRRRQRWMMIVLFLLCSVLLSGCGGGSPFDSSGGVKVCDSRTFTPAYGVSIGLTRWQHLPVTVAFENTVTYNNTDLRDVLKSGFDEWVTGTDGKIGYTVVDSGSSPNIEVTFNVLPSRPSAQGELGLTTIKDQGAKLTDASIRMDVWDGMTADEVMIGLKATAAHEFGHALGLGGHSDSPSDVMYPAHATNRGVPVSQRDINTLKSAYCTEYGRAQIPCPGVGCASNSSPTRSITFGASQEGQLLPRGSVIKLRPATEEVQ